MPRGNYQRQYQSNAMIVYTQGSGVISSAEEENEFVFDRRQRIATRKTRRFHERRRLREELEMVGCGICDQDSEDDELPEGAENIPNISQQQERENYENERRRY